MDSDVNETPRLSLWERLKYNWMPSIWAVQHWAVTHLLPLKFCHSCSGYFYEQCMTLPDKCQACYARDYGIPV